MKLKNKLLIPILSVLLIAIVGLGFIIINQIENKLVLNLIEDQMNNQLDNLSSNYYDSKRDRRNLLLHS